MPYLTVKVETNEKGEQVYRTRGPNIGEKIIEHMEKRHKKNQSPQPSSVSTLQNLNVEIRMSNQQVRKAAEIEKMVREESIVLDKKDTQLLQRYNLRKNELEQIQTETHHQAARLNIEFEQEL